MPLPYEVHYRLLTLAQPVAAEISASRPERRAWVTVYPVVASDERDVYRSIASSSERAGIVFSVETFEFEREDLEKSQNPDGDWIPTVVDETTQIVTSEEVLVEVLSRWLPNLNELRQLRHVGFPLNYQ
jgi:hypothetical protein